MPRLRVPSQATQERAALAGRQGLASVCGPSTAITCSPRDFVENRTHDGRKLRRLDGVNEFTHEGLAIRVARLKATNVITDVIACALRPVHASRGGPGHMRSRNGPEFVAQAVRNWIRAVGRTAFGAPGSPWDGGGSENGPGDWFPDHGLRGRLQRPPPGRVAQRGDLPQPARGRDRGREPEAAPQHRAASRPSRLQATRLRRCSSQPPPPGRLRHSDPLRQPSPPKPPVAPQPVLHQHPPRTTQ